MTPWLCERFGRKIALGFFFSMMFVFIAFAFGRVFYFQTNALAWFMGCLFFLGIGGANFSVSFLFASVAYLTEQPARAPSFLTTIQLPSAACTVFPLGVCVV